MRLSTRLDALETATGGGELSPLAAKMLVSLIARRDAWFWPMRSFGSYRSEVARFQRDYLAGSDGLRSKTQGESNWKAGHHARKELICAGFATPIIQGGQVTSLRFTALGEATARAMVGDRLHSVDVAMVLVDRWLELEGRVHCGKKWVSESELFGIELHGDPSSWEALTELVLPLLVAGVMVANCDMHGRAYYRAGNGVKAPERISITVEADPNGDRDYIEAFDSERSSILSMECTSGELVIPISVT